MENLEPQPEEPYYCDEMQLDKWLDYIGIDWQISPELAAARHSHRIYYFSLEPFQFHDPARAKWARRFQGILFNPVEIKRLRHEYLTPAENREVRREIAECRAEFRREFKEPAEGPPCPTCGEPLRTRKAQQCFHCGADWHDRRSDKE